MGWSEPKRIARFGPSENLSEPKIIARFGPSENLSAILGETLGISPDLGLRSVAQKQALCLFIVLMRMSSLIAVKSKYRTR